MPLVKFDRRAPDHQPRFTSFLFFPSCLSLVIIIILLFGWNNLLQSIFEVASGGNGHLCTREIETALAGDVARRTSVSSNWLSEEHALKVSSSSGTNLRDR